MIKSSIKYYGLLTIIVLFIIPSVTADDCIWTPSELFHESFEGKILLKMDELHAPSLAFSVLNGTEVFYSKGFGDQPGIDIAYHLNSASKMITGTAILQLYEQGLLSIEDDINDFLPYELKNPYYPNSTITVKHLLSHQSSLMGSMDGFEDYWPSLNNGTCTFPSIIYEFFHVNGTYYVEDNWENSEPGTGIVYSDAAIDILTLIVENVTSTTFDTYVTNNILIPLGMTNTRFRAEDYSSDKLAIGYDWNISTSTNDIKPYFNNSGNPGGGGYFSTVEDMSKYMLTHLNQGEYNGVNILNATTVELMHTEIETNKFALTWRVRQVFGSNTGYEGLTGGPVNGFYSACFIRNSLGVVLLINQGSWDINLADFSDLYGLICDQAIKIYNDKCPSITPTLTDEGIFYLLPSLILLSTFGIILKIKRRKN